TQAFKVFFVFAASLDIALCAFMNAADFVIGQLAHDFAYADHQRVVGDFAAFGNDGAGADQAVAPDDGIVQHDGLYADKGAVVYRAPVQHGLMPDRDVFADVHGNANVHVQYAAFLN